MHIKYLLVLLGFFLFSATMSQEISTINLSMINVHESDEMLIIPNPKLDVKNHSWSLGPVFLFSYGDQIEDRQSLKLTGIAIGYEHFPHGRNSKWNMFHSMDLITQRIRDKQQSQYFDIPNAQFIPNEITQTDIDFLLSKNVGVLWKFSDKLASSAMMGIGVNATIRNTTSDLEEFDDLFLKQIWSIKLGVRYQLGK